MPAVMPPRTRQKQQGKGNGTHVLHPWAVPDAASITSLQAEANEGVIALGRQARYTVDEDLVAQVVSDILGVKTVKNPLAIEEATTQ
jgi:hypothetical protein